MMRSFPDPTPARHIHFVGIGGIGMSAIAKILVGFGFSVTGSDVRESPNTIRLRDLGIKVYIGHDRAHTRDVDIVVRSSAISPENPEILDAHDRGIPVWERAEVLAWIMGRFPQRVAVAGTHGKTTTTSMIAHILKIAGGDPTFLIGGVANEHDYNASLGKGPVVIAEADESDGSFLMLPPTHSVITNIEPEHMDYYGKFDNVMDAFQKFAEKHPKEGALVMNIDQENIQKLISLSAIACPVISYGLTEKAEVRALDCQFKEMQTTFRVERYGKKLGKVELNVPGFQNVLDSLAAMAITLQLGYSPDQIIPALVTFRSARRRFQVIGIAGGVTIVDDYAHHPTEVKFTIEAARLGWNGAGKIIVVFQPHRYTRTRDLMMEFASAFDKADEVIITDIYSADEAPIAGVTAKDLSEKIQASGSGPVHYVGRKESVAQHLLPKLSSGDIVIFTGAGDIYHSAKEIYALLHDQEQYAKQNA